ncbi:lipopolysaccharide-induced transcription factor regulating tumor necrosis factor alpha, putative [Glarea lozoyensis ATCC 20868]|uniref:Lipopolysaccharide-induced transcription factor regulating tumor necrosis factor alpha, putative n=1 Tax=Glarea lozoyensis (strain ATCC 20868 / MF5171) TaxID=1116229 RepID=S3DTB3_GLAL2|nr:lipopolysaccharide-induced transcription factor regulating tumor necrosis factor alpha, putative [Glarea lozoyensis ATCC 20868]EPE35191.1 lipopolysaccharide-induced transcription factor regulating tumor necrosis factor alpha, putative [Glarea lozoyensis ATCC 20868]
MDSKTTPQTDLHHQQPHQTQPTLQPLAQPLHHQQATEIPQSDHQINQQHPIEMSAPPPSYAQEKTNPQHSNGAPPTHAQGGPPRNLYTHASPLNTLQSVPTPVDCPFCGVRELTRTEFVSGGTTHGSALLLCCCFCLGCIPYIGSWLKDCEHNCGHCGQLLAVWHRSGRTEVIAHPARQA